MNLPFRTTYRDAISKFRWPSWLAREKLKQPDGSVVETDNRLLFIIAAVLDEFSERVRLGIEARYPGLGADDARAQQGRDRNVLRGPSETAAAYDARLIRAVDDQRQKGNAEALLRQVAGYFNPFAVRLRIVDNSGNWTTLDETGTLTFNYFQVNWNWDGAAVAASWGRFWLLIYPLSTGAFTDAGAWGVADGQKWGDPGCYGCSLSVDQATSLRRLCLDWKPDGVMPEWIVLALDAASFVPTAAPGAPLPDGTWCPYGQPASGAVVTPCRLSTARYGDVDPTISLHH